jgi:hypothetical protein
MEIRRLLLARGKMERAMSFLTTSRAGLCRPEGRFTKFYLALPQQSLYSFPDPQGHLSLGFGMKHLQLLAYTEHCTFRVSARKKFHGQSKKGLTFGTARADALVQMRIKPAPKSESSRACRITKPQAALQGQSHYELLTTHVFPNRAGSARNLRWMSQQMWRRWRSEGIELNSDLD